MTENASPLEMSPEDFRALGHRLVDRIADYLDSLATRKRTTATHWTPEALRARLPRGGMPEAGADAAALIDEAAELIFDGYRRNGHPGYWGYIMGSPAPIGILGDMLAAGANANLAAWHSAPVPSEIEAQTVRWLAEFLGYPTDCGGLLTSGGNVANFIGVLAARRAHAARDMQARGLAGSGAGLRLYTSTETHTWIEKAADLFGLGTDAIRWIETDRAQRIDLAALEARIEADRTAGEQPFLVIGSAGTVSTGAVDPLPEIAALCRRHGLWFHVDGAYGAPAAAASLAPAALKGLAAADSLAIDAHKWLCVPLEAGCALVRDRANLRATFAHHPPYYFYPGVGGDVMHYHEYGPQNSRCFRALKVWLALRHVGRAGYAEAIDRTIRLAREMHRLVEAAPDLEAGTQSLSITTFRYVPADLDRAADGAEAYLNDLNRALVERIQAGEQVFFSNAVVDGRFLLRACIVNFRTAMQDIEAVPGIVTRLGRELDRQMRAGGEGGRS